MGTWTFKQLAGKRKTFALTDASAPLGRPRKDPVVTDAIEVRQAVVYYPGNSDSPTRHLFGTKYAPWEIKGYLRDRNLGPGGAQVMVEQIKQFLADKQRIRVTWDDVVSVVGLMTSFSPGREARGEIKWDMKIDVDSDDFADRPPAPTIPLFPTDYTAQIQLYLETLAGIAATPSLLGSILDVIEDALDALLAAVTLVDALADTTQDFQSASYAQLSQMSSQVVAIQVAAFQIHETFAGAGPDVALWRQRANDNLLLADQQTSVEETLRQLMAKMAALSLQAQIAAAGRIRTTVMAQGSDTWEAIAMRVYGSADRASDLQIANGQVGGLPRPGTEIRVPA